MVATPYFDVATRSYAMIAVEYLVRDLVSNNFNLYILSLFACCREILITKPIKDEPLKI